MSRLLRLDAESVADRLEPGDDADQLGPVIARSLTPLGLPSPLALIERSNAPAQTEWPTTAPTVSNSRRDFSRPRRRVRSTGSKDIWAPG